MSLEKAIKHGKEKRKEYYDSREFDRICRNHKSCKYCENNRLHAIKRDKEKTEFELLSILENN